MKSLSILAVFTALAAAAPTGSTKARTPLVDVDVRKRAWPPKWVGSNEFFNQWPTPPKLPILGHKEEIKLDGKWDEETMVHLTKPPPCHDKGGVVAWECCQWGLQCEGPICADDEDDPQKEDEDVGAWRKRDLTAAKAKRFLWHPFLELILGDSEESFDEDWIPGRAVRGLAQAAPGTAQAQRRAVPVEAISESPKEPTPTEEGAHAINPQVLLEVLRLKHEADKLKGGEPKQTPLETEQTTPSPPSSPGPEQTPTTDEAPNQTPEYEETSERLINISELMSAGLISKKGPQSGFED